MTYPPIYIATNNGDMGGGEVMLLQIAWALSGCGVAVTVVAPAQPAEIADAAEAAGIATIRLPASGRKQWMRELRHWDRRVRLADRRAVLWCNGLVPAAATTGHRRRIVHLHQKPLGHAQALLVPAARLGALATLVPSRYMQGAFRGSTVLPNWTAPLDAPRPKHHPDMPYTVGYLGRLSTDKGVVTLASAMRILQAQEPGRHRLLVAGEPRFVDPRDYAIVDASLRSLGGIVERPGWMDRAEFFARIDVLAIPSQCGESFGLTAAEAMAARVRLIVTRDGALPEVVGPAGMTVPARSAAALAAALSQVLGSGDHAPMSAPELNTQARIEALYQRWRENYSPEAGSQAIQRLLGSLFS